MSQIGRFDVTMSVRVGRVGECYLTFSHSSTIALGIVFIRIMLIKLD